MANDPDLKPRPDFDVLRKSLGDARSVDEIAAQYHTEKRLAAKILACPAAGRPKVYIEAYSELFAVTDFDRRPSQRQRHIDFLKRRLRHRVRKEGNFLEIGCGDAAVAGALAPHLSQAYAIDATDALIKHDQLPSNVEFMLAGTKIPLPNSSIDFVFSEQVMEHLHPEDAVVQISEIFRVLKKGGTYLCITPNRATGPHDISNFFSYEARGLHLHEYSLEEIVTLFHSTGFQQIEFNVSAVGFEVRLPRILLSMFERVLLSLPKHMRAALSRSNLVRVLAGLDVMARKN